MSDIEETGSTAGLAVPTKKVSVQLGMAPQTLEEGWRLATMMAKSSLVPKGFSGKPEDVLVAIELGLEVGLPPMQALQSIAVINGRPSLFGEGFLAVIMSSPNYQDHDEYYEVDGQRKEGLTADDLKKEDTAAVCVFWRCGKKNPVTARFSIAQARKAGLLEKPGPWKDYCDRMLKMRARSWAGRDAFPDVLRGIRTTEEAIDTPAEDVIEAPRMPPSSAVRRLSESVPEAVTAPAPVGPVEVCSAVAKVSQTDDGAFEIVLASGEVLETEVLPDAIELEKFAGRPEVLRFTCRRDEAALLIERFALKD